MTASEFLNKLKEFSVDASNLFQYRQDEKRCNIEFDPRIGLFLTIVTHEDDTFDFYFLERTSSWTYIDERTDIHDILSILISVWLRTVNDFTFTTYDIGHPADATLNKFEIYGRYLVPSQLSNEYTKICQESLDNIIMIIIQISILISNLWKAFGGYPCMECKKRLEIKYDYKNSLPKSMTKKLSEILNKSENFDYNKDFTFDFNLKDRQLPTWKYFRDFKTKTTFVYSPAVTDMLNIIYNRFIKDETVIDSVNGLLFYQKQLKALCTK